MTGGVLFVCAMNVCRSPVMEFGFRGPSAREPFGDIAISSRGVSAVDGAKMCAVGAAVIGDAEEGRHFADAHVSRRLDAAFLEDQRIILTATRAERAAVAQLSPSVRSRTFTVREAVALGSAAAVGMPDAGTVTGLPLAPETLDEYVRHLDRNRALLGPQAHPPRSRGWIRRRSADPLDIADPHADQRRRHERVLRAVVDEVVELRHQVFAFRG